MADQPSYAAVPDYARVQAMRATEDERNLKRFRAFSDLQFDKFAGDKPNYTDPTYSNVLDRKEDGSRGKIFGNYDEEIDERRKKIEEYNASIDEKAKDKKSKGMGKKIYSGDMPGDKDRYLLANTERYYLHDLNYYKDLEAYGNKAKQLFAQTGNPKYKEMADKIFGVEGPDGTLSGGQLAQVSRGIQGTILKSLASALESGSTYAASELMHHYSRGMGSGLQFVATGTTDNVGNKTYDVYGSDNRILQKGLSARHITDFLTRGESNAFTTLMDAQAVEATKQQGLMERQGLVSDTSLKVAGINAASRNQAANLINRKDAENKARMMASNVITLVDNQTGQPLTQRDTKLKSALDNWLYDYQQEIKQGRTPEQAVVIAETNMANQFGVSSTYKPLNEQRNVLDIFTDLSNRVFKPKTPEEQPGTNVTPGTPAQKPGTPKVGSLGGANPDSTNYGPSSGFVAQATYFINKLRQQQQQTPVDVNSLDPTYQELLNLIRNQPPPSDTPVQDIPIVQ